MEAREAPVLGPVWSHLCGREIRFQGNTLAEVRGWLEQFTETIFFPAVILIGWIGCQVDSILGAILENRGFLAAGAKGRNASDA